MNAVSADPVVEACVAQIAACVELYDAYCAIQKLPRTDDGSVDWAEDQRRQARYGRAKRAARDATRASEEAQDSAWAAMREGFEQPQLWA